MLLTLTDLSQEPLQQQIIRQIRAKILSGELEPGTDIPSIRILARDNRVSVITVKNAYESLEQQGLIHARRGKGFFVSDISAGTRKEMSAGLLIDQLDPVLRNAREIGFSSGEIMRLVEEILMVIKNTKG